MRTCSRKSAAFGSSVADVPRARDTFCKVGSSYRSREKRMGILPVKQLSIIQQSPGRKAAPCSPKIGATSCVCQSDLPNHIVKSKHWTRKFACPTRAYSRRLYAGNGLFSHSKNETRSWRLILVNVAVGFKIIQVLLRSAGGSLPVRRQSALC